MAALSWGRCSRQRRSRDRECVLGEGRQLEDGSVTPAIPKDSLTRHAEAEMDRWVKSLNGRQRKRVPSRYRGDRARKPTESNRTQQRSHSRVARPPVLQPTPAPSGWHWCPREKRLVTGDGIVVPLVDHQLVGTENERAAYRALHGSGPTTKRS